MTILHVIQYCIVPGHEYEVGIDGLGTLWGVLEAIIHWPTLLNKDSTRLMAYPIGSYYSE